MHPSNTHSHTQISLSLSLSLSMGNYISHRPSSKSTAKIILSDGTIDEFEQPITVAELMLDHPQHVVVEFESIYTKNGKKPMPLPADKKLDKKKVYLMLPMKRGGGGGTIRPAALSSEDARRVLFSANSMLRSRSFLCSSSIFLPFLAKICPAGGQGGEGETGFVMPKKESSLVQVLEEERSNPEFFPEVSDGRPEYLSRQFSGKGWKPSLDTIKEKKIEKKVSHWLF